MDELMTKIENVFGEISEDLKELVKKYGIYLVILLAIAYIWKKVRDE